jgi:hypothetical protein
MPRRSRRALLLLLKLALLGISLLLSLLLAELAVRIVRPQPTSWLNFYAPADIPPYGLQHNIARTINSGTINWTVYTDGNGFRVAKTPLYPAAPVLLTLGDSFIFGFAVEYEQTMPGIIQASVGERFHVINAGVPGYGPTQYRQVLERELSAGMPVKGVIAITYVGNDFLDCVTDKHIPIRDGILGNESSLRSVVKRNSHLYRLASNAFHRMHESKGEARPEEAVLYKPQEWSNGKLKDALAIYRDEFIKIRDICAARQLPLLVCVIPTDQAVLEPKPPFDLPVKQAMSVLSEAGIPSIDLTPPLVQAGAQKTYLGWDFHFTALGNQIAGQAIAQAWLNSPK